VNASADAERIRICVEDQGQGIPEAQRESIFEPFVQGEPVLTRRHGGAGIGLTLVKRQALSHGGQVWAEPAGDKGSRFILLLPRNPEKTL
jgi:signal transduction histidine kinase